MAKDRYITDEVMKMNVNDQEELVQALINDINRSSPYKKSLPERKNG